MKTIYQLQQIAARLRAVTEVNSISPEDTFGLQADLLEYLADMEQNAEGLGIHKVYASYAAMVADATAPVGSNGKVLRFGQLVAICDFSNPSQPENGNVYAWQKGNTGSSAWLLMGNLTNVLALKSQVDNIGSKVGNAALPGMNDIVATIDKFREVYGYIQTNGKFIGSPTRHGTYIPVASYTGKMVEFVQGTYSKVQYAFVTEAPEHQTDYSVLCNGYTLVTADFNGMTELIVPNDCAYLYILVKNGETNTAPQSVIFKTSSTVTELIADIVPRLSSNENKIEDLSAHAASQSLMVGGIHSCISPIQGKIGIIGDSISTYEGYLPDGFLSFYPQVDRGVESVNDTWWDIFASYTGCTIQNISWSGSRVTDTNPQKLDFYARTNMLDAPDYIFVELGCNDHLNQVEIGNTYDFDADISELSESVFIPAYIKGIKALMANYPNAQIIILIMPMTYEYSEPIRNIAAHFSIPVIETGGYYWNRTNGDINVHPTASEMKGIANIISSFLNTYVYIDDYAKKGISKLPIPEKNVITGNMGVSLNHDTLSVIDMNSLPLHECSLGSSYTWYKIDDNKWHRDGGGQCHVTVPVMPGETYRIENISENAGFYGFLKSDYTGDYSNGDTIPYVAGYQRLRIKKMSSTYVTIPLNCTYLCLVIVDGAANKISYNLSKVVQKKELLEVKEIIDLDAISEESGVVNVTVGSIGEWYQKNNAYTHKTIPVIPGQIYRIHASYSSNSYYSQVKGYDNDGITRSSYDAFRHTVLKFGVETITIFDDVNYLVLSTKSNSVDVTPYKIELVGTTSSDFCNQMCHLFDKEIIVGSSSIETADATGIGVYYDTITNKASMTGSSKLGAIRAGFNCSSLINGKKYRLRFKVKNTGNNNVRILQLSSLEGQGARLVTIPGNATLCYDERYIHCSAYPYIGVYKGEMTEDVCLSFEYFEILPYYDDSLDVDEVPFKFKHAHWNVAHFSYFDGAQGSYNTSIDAEHSDEMALRYRKAINSISSDVFGIAEYNPEFDTSGKLAKDVLFSNYSKQYVGKKYFYNCNSLFFKSIFNVVGGWETDLTPEIQIQHRYYKVILVRMNGRIVHFVETHLDFGDAEVRLAQVRQLIDFFADKDYVVMSADWNAPMSLYETFVDAGYTISNCGYIGDYATIRSGITDPTVGRLDNIICKGFEMSNIQVYQDTMSDVGEHGGLSDHAAISCDLHMIL